MSIVVDCSVALAWVFEDEATPEVEALLDRVAVDGIAAPALWIQEIGNGLRSGMRRGRVDADRVAAFLALLSDLPLRLDAPEGVADIGALLMLCERHDLTAYDAAYLETAMRLKLPLATADGKLRRAATAEGVALLP